MNKKNERIVMCFRKLSAEKKINIEFNFYDLPTS